MGNFGPYLAILMAATIWGSNGVFIRYLNFPPTTLSFFRLAVPTLLIYIYFTVKKTKMLKGNRQLMLTASLLNALRILLYFIGFTLTSIGNAVILLYMYPIYTVILESKLLNEKIDAKTRGLIATSFLGMVLVFLNKGLTFSGRSLLGMIAVSMSAIIWGWVVVILKREVHNYTDLEKIFYQNLVGAFLFLPFLFFYPFPSLAFSLIGIGQAALIGVIGFVLFFAGLKKVSVSVATALCYIEVASAIALAAIFYKEIPSLNVIIGGFIIITSTFLLTRQQVKK